jgi:ABC-type nitrate/sulfonate/bicarbonate transport system permease component
MTKNVVTEVEPGLRGGELSPASGAVVDAAAGVRGIGRGVPSVVVILAALGVWEAVARSGILPQRWSPAASTVLVTLAQQVVTLSFWTAVGQTLEGWAVGLALATVIAVPLGLVIGSVPLLYHAVRVPIEFLRPVPSVALVPLAVLVFGLGITTKVFLVVFAATWPLLLQTIYGVQDVDPVAMDTMRSFGVGRLRRLVVVTLPSASPYVATGLRLSSSVALILAVTAELVVGAPGIGSQITAAENGNSTALVYALIVATGGLGWALSFAIRRAEARALAWHPAYRTAGEA